MVSITNVREVVKYVEVKCCDACQERISGLVQSVEMVLGDRVAIAGRICANFPDLGTAFFGGHKKIKSAGIN